MFIFMKQFNCDLENEDSEHTQELMDSLIYLVVVVLIHRSKAELYFFPIGQPGFLSNQAGSLFRPHTSSKVIAYIP